MSRVEGHIDYNEAEGGPFVYNELWTDYNGNGIHARGATRMRDEFDRYIVVFGKRSG